MDSARTSNPYRRVRAGCKSLIGACRAELYGVPLTPCRKPVHPDGWTRFCPDHAERYRTSYEQYKAASASAEAIRDCVVVWEDKAGISGLRTLADVHDAIELTETYIQFASEELRGRRIHTMVFFAHDPPDKGHVKRTDLVQRQISSAYDILDSLRDRLVDLTPPEPRMRKSRKQRGKKKERTSSQSHELPGILCAAVSIDFGYLEEDEESPLRLGMGAEEVLADLRTEREAEEMMDWYATLDDRGYEGDVSENEDEDEDEASSMGPFVTSLVNYLQRLGLAGRI